MGNTSYTKSKYKVFPLSSNTMDFENMSLNFFIKSSDSFVTRVKNFLILRLNLSVSTYLRLSYMYLLCRYLIYCVDKNFN